MHITVFNQQRDLPISTSSVKRLISCLFSALHITTDEIIIYFVTDKKMRTVHHTFFNDPSSTDCMSFPLEAITTPSILGEVFVCPKVAIQYAQTHGLNPYEEASRYLVHSILHLIGYDDLEPSAKKNMRRKENWCLKLLAREGKFLAKKTHSRYVLK